MYDCLHLCTYPHLYLEERVRIIQHEYLDCQHLARALGCCHHPDAPPLGIPPPSAPIREQGGCGGAGGKIETKNI